MTVVIPTFVKDPAEVLDYVFDWAPLTNGRPGALSNWLASGETIASRTITAGAGITVGTSTITDGNTSVTVWLSGGTAGANYLVTCNIVTSASRTGERSARLLVRER